MLLPQFWQAGSTASTENPSLTFLRQEPGWRRVCTWAPPFHRTFRQNNTPARCHSATPSFNYENWTRQMPGFGRTSPHPSPTASWGANISPAAALKCQKVPWLTTSSWSVQHCWFLQAAAPQPVIKIFFPQNAPLLQGILMIPSVSIKEIFSKNRERSLTLGVPVKQGY